MKESSPSIKPGDGTDLHNHISARKISNKLKDFAMVDYVYLVDIVRVAIVVCFFLRLC